MHIKFIQDLESVLAGDLPGEEAQLLMAPVHPDNYRTLTEDYKTACVLVLLFPKNKEWHVCFIERSTSNPHDKHAGQLSFPGGQLETQDDSYEDCALREAREEIGIAPESVGILGALSPLFVFVSNFLVHPFVGFTTEYPNYVKQDSEVSDIIEVPLKHFTKPKTKAIDDMEIRGEKLKVPYYNIGDKKLWGATAMIMSEFEHILSQIMED